MTDNKIVLHRSQITEDRKKTVKVFYVNFRKKVKLFYEKNWKGFKLEVKIENVSKLKNGLT